MGVEGGLLHRFNSTLVRLSPENPLDQHYVLAKFQFHSGSIKPTRAGETRRLLRRGFNSTLVRLSPGIDETREAERVRGFNSTLVRLSRVNVRMSWAKSVSFQFHSGSIKPSRKRSSATS